MPWKNAAAVMVRDPDRTQDHEARVERRQDSGQVGRRIRVRDVAANRAAIPHRRIADVSGRLRQRRRVLAHDRRRRQFGVRRQRADPQRRRPSHAMPLQLGDPSDVDEHRRAARRSLSSGIRLWPPARIFAPGMSDAAARRFGQRVRRAGSRSWMRTSRSAHSSATFSRRILVADWCFDCALSCRLHGAPDALGRHRHAAASSTPSGASASSTAL